MDPDPESSPSRKLPHQGQQQQEQVNRPASFEFVGSNDHRQIRSHAMRESWRQRNQRASMTVGGNSISLLVSSPEAISDDDRLLPRDRIFVDLRHTVKPPRTSNSEPRWIISSIPESLSHSITPYQPLSQNDALDPFNSLQIDTEDQKLLYHCESNSQDPEQDLTKKNRGKHLRGPSFW